MTGRETRENRIKSLLPEEIAVLRVFEETDSTNTQARSYAAEGGIAPALFLADCQTAGRGRTGKTFYSPKNTGLYTSLLLPSKSVTAVYMTTAAAVAVRRAIERVTGISTCIKWVNDLYSDGKKVAGILCESVFVGNVGYVIIGVGINLSTKEFPSDIACTAASLGLEADEGIKDRLAAVCAEELLSVWKSGLTADLMTEYKEHSAILGKTIRFTQNGVAMEGTAEDIDDRGRLSVLLDGGKIALLSSGEISVRLI